MITCGQTHLVNAVLEFADKIPPEKIDSLIFERKNEYFPRHQRSDFYEDCKRLKQKFSGSAFRFGHADDHHLFVFHMNKPYQPKLNDYTLEILMYDLQGRGREVFGKENQTVKSIRELTGVHQLLEGFKIDDYVFSPRGYSLNAVKGVHYYTVHVTPEETGSYVSFESNIELTEDIKPLVSKVVKTFEPNSFDVVLFSPTPIKPTFDLNDFYMRSRVTESLSCGFDVNFVSYFKENSEIQRATEL